MSRITTICLEGFKEQHRTVNLEERNLLLGPNGAGKSAVMEGLIYALTGAVPAGRSPELVARYFGPKGGSVRVVDADANWITRGIEVGKGGKISQILESEGDWETNEALLNIREFLGLSADKRRGFILELVGSGKLDDLTELECQIGDATAKQLAGPAATLDNLAVEDKILDLPEELQPVVRLWPGAWEHIQSVAAHHRGTASQLFQRLTKDAAELKNAARKAGVRHNAAAAELEQGVKGAKIAAAELQAADSAVIVAEKDLGDQRETAGVYQERLDAFRSSGRDVISLENRMLSAVDRVKGFGPLGDKPEAPEPSPEGPELDKRLATILKDREAIEEAIRESEALRRKSEQLADVEARLKALEAEPIGELVARMQEVKEQMRPASGAGIELMGLLEEAVAKVAASWNQSRRECEAAIAKHREDLPAGMSVPLSISPKIGERLAELKADEEETRVALLRVAEGEKAAYRVYVEALGSREEELERRKAQTDEAEALRRELQAAKKDQKARLKALQNSTAPEVASAEKALEKAQEALSRAQEAAGEVQAYERAIANAQEEKDSEALWKAVEGACKGARETYVAQVVGPLVDDLHAVLRACGRSERVYLRLENDHGSPIFDLGWSDGTSRTSIVALSAGEAAIFSTALVVTLSRWAKGRRVLLAEVDPLDPENLWRYLEAVRGLEDAWDACLVATKEPSVNDQGWNVVRFAGSGEPLPEPQQRELGPEEQARADAYNDFVERKGFLKKRGER